MKWSMLLTNLLALILGGILLTGCNDRNMVVGSSTTFGVQLSASDIRTRPPKVAIAYDRQELALIPTSGQVAGKNDGDNTDTFSSLMALSLDTQLGGKTTLQQFIGTGHAAVEVAGSREMSEVFGDVAFNADDWWLISQIADVVYNDEKIKESFSPIELIEIEKIKAGLDKFAKERGEVAKDIGLRYWDDRIVEIPEINDFRTLLRYITHIQTTVNNLEYERSEARPAFNNANTVNGIELDPIQTRKRKLEYITETSRGLVKVPEYGRLIDLVHGKLKGERNR